MNIGEIRARAEALKIEKDKSEIEFRPETVVRWLVNAGYKSEWAQVAAHCADDIPALLDALEAKEQEISRLNCVHTAARVTIDGLNAIIKDQNEQLTAAVGDMKIVHRTACACDICTDNGCVNHGWDKCPAFKWRGLEGQK